VIVDDPAFASAAALGRAFARRERSPVDVVEALLARIARLDPALVCFITVTGERALDEARVAERELAAGRTRGPLHGVPIGLKDLIDTALVRTTAGSRVLATHVPARDATVVERLGAAGILSLGKLNLHEFAFGTTSTNPHWGTCRNPWNRDRVPGGSSGGSGAGLAAGLFPLALGTDTGGSIRIPASCCGVVGFKPTFGVVSRTGVCPLAWTLDHVGPMARTVEDAALLLDAMAGPDPRDPWSAGRAEPGSFGRDLARGVEGMRVGMPDTLFFADLEPDVEAAVDAAVRVLEGAGARVTRVRWDLLDEAYTAFHALLASEAAAFHRPWLAERPEDYSEAMRAALEIGYMVSAVDYVDARRFQQRLRESLAEAMRGADVLLTPTLPRTAPAIGEPVSREPLLAWNRFMPPFNLTGAPAISVPCGFDRAGLPIGLQLSGRIGEDATVLRVAAAYERETDWHARHPEDA
jgi:aspartyl-tRNA(Asn)/glutamyl-tRNA(Gln) amidotransferase subunit A